MGLRFHRAISWIGRAEACRFDRLHTLRIRLLHGGPILNNSVNRAQLRGSVAMPRFLLPVFVDLMMNDPQQDRGRPSFPVVAQTEGNE